MKKGFKGARKSRQAKVPAVFFVGAAFSRENPALNESRLESRSHTPERRNRL
jgi:hypothetical protein